MTPRSLQILHAMGVPVYRKSVAKVARKPETMQTTLATKPTPARPPVAIDTERATAAASSIAPRAAPTRAIGPVATARTRSTAIEFVVPQAELMRFQTSKLRLHLALTLLVPDAPTSANSDARDTAVLLDVPEQSVLKIGSLARLRSQWRAKREAWLAIRMWRKQWR